MNIISWNVNGIRAVERKGELENLLKTYDPDVLLFQEIKAKPEQLSDELLAHPEYEQYYHPAEKPGYAGTAIWMKSSFAKATEDKGAIKFSSGMPDFADTEGRIARLDIGNRTIFGVYFPNGGKSPEAWEGKLKFYDQFLSHVDDLKNQGRDVIWGGDVNCAHEEIDLARPKANDGKIGFHPSERAWVDEVLAHGWVDVFRSRYPETIMYSWWDVITRARSRNVGWRIDYFFVDGENVDKVRQIEYLNDQMGSDHCPVMISLE